MLGGTTIIWPFLQIAVSVPSLTPLYILPYSYTHTLKTWGYLWIVWVKIGRRFMDNFGNFGSLLIFYFAAIKDDPQKSVSKPILA
jgi:hypothetical protein